MTRTNSHMRKVYAQRVTHQRLIISKATTTPQRGRAFHDDYTK